MPIILKALLIPYLLRNLHLESTEALANQCETITYGTPISKDEGGKNMKDLLSWMLLWCILWHMFVDSIYKA